MPIRRNFLVHNGAPNSTPVYLPFRSDLTPEVPPGLAMPNFRVYIEITISMADPIEFAFET